MQRKATFWAAAVTGKVIVRAHFSLLQINSKLKANFIKWCTFMFSSLPLFIKGDSKCLPQREPNIRLTHMFNTCIINHRNTMSIWEVSACTRHSPQKQKIMVPRRSQLLFHRGDKCRICFHKDSAQRYSNINVILSVLCLRW